MFPIDHPDAPKYWMAESSGVLKPVVHKLVLHGEDLDANEIHLMQALPVAMGLKPAVATQRNAGGAAALRVDDDRDDGRCPRCDPRAAVNYGDGPAMIIDPEYNVITKAEAGEIVWDDLTEGATRASCSESYGQTPGELISDSNATKKR